MYTCDQCREKIWEDLFGLLDAGESETLHLHLAACEQCQTERATAIAQHRFVAEAARLNVNVPPFTPPLVESPQPVSQPRHPDTGAVRPRGRALPWLAAAAAVLLLISLPFGLYQYGRARYDAAWQTAEHTLAEIVKQRQELQTKARRDQANLVHEMLAKHPRLRAVGPAAYQPGAVNRYHVWITDIEGSPVDAPVTARLLDAAKSVVLDTKKSKGKGEWLVELPANLPLGPESAPRLELAARDEVNPGPLLSYLRVLEPAYRTHLAIDKPLYHTGDTIRFRSLTLERLGLKVPDRTFTAIYTLSDLRGKEYQTLRGLTWKGGIGGGAFELSPNWPAGEYRLTVAEAENCFPPVTHRFWVLPAVPLDPGRGETSAHTKSMEPERLEVEFFPEGGDLVADLDNRVYFRVRTPLGQPAELQGVVIDSHGRDVVAVHTFHPESRRERGIGLGIFTLRPRLGETYRLRVTSPRGLDIVGALPPVQAKGLVLSLPSAVGRPGEPIRVLLRQTGPARDLVIALFCQGRLAGEELVTAESGSTELQLTPMIPCSGVLRLTVFEERQGQLWPLAERLAYRRPEKQLVLAVKADKEQYAPGESIKLNIESRNEKGMPEPAWILAAVVNQRVLSRKTDSVEAAVPAYFHLLSELQQPDDIEQADILLSDSAEAATALDLFLGTHGWRRFVEHDNDPKQDSKKGNIPFSHRAEDMAVPAIVKLDNLEEAERRYATSLSQASVDLHDALVRQDKELANESAERLQAARTAGQELNSYEARAGTLIKLSLGLGGVVLFVVGCLLVTVALGGMLSRPQKSLPRLIPQRAANGWHVARERKCLAGAFAALALCVLILWQPFGGWDRSRNAIDLTSLASYAARLDTRLDLAAIPLPKNQNLVPSQALSKRRGPFPQEASSKPLAAVRPNEEAEPPAQSHNPRPRIGFIGAGHGQNSPPPVPAHQRPPLSPLPIRAYAYSSSKEPALGGEYPDVILWQPILFAENGAAEVTFTLPSRAATYRVHVQGHSADGRLGAIHDRLECR